MTETLNSRSKEWDEHCAQLYKQNQHKWKENWGTIVYTMNGILIKDGYGNIIKQYNYRNKLGQQKS